MSDQKELSQSVPTKEPSKYLSLVLVICGVVLFSCVVFSCITVVFISRVIGNPQGIEVRHVIPSQVSVDEEFDLILQIVNTGDSEVFISDIDLKSMFNPTIEDGALVLRTDPEMERDYSLESVSTYHYNHTLAPGETQKVIFHLKAFKIGNFGGQVAVWAGISACEVYPSFTVIP